MFLCHKHYDPAHHAEQLGLTIIYRDDVPGDDVVACYSEKHQTIFLRTNLSTTVERCAIAHEIVHYEFADVGHTREQEDRADRMAARRLIDPEQFMTATAVSNYVSDIAQTLAVTVRIMRAYLKDNA